MSNLNRGSRLLAGVCALAISAGLCTARAQDTSTQQASAVSTEARPSVPATEIAAPPAIATEPAAAAEAEAPAQQATPLKPVEVRPAAKQASGGPADRPYFVEFRARSAMSYGHTFLVHGRVGDPITAKSVVGLHPAEKTGDETPWMIGHFIPVASETGWSDGDVGYNDKYIIAKYRVYLTEAEYRVVLAKMREMQRNTPMWHAVIYNCNAFIGDIARFHGPRGPSEPLADAEGIHQRHQAGIRRAHAVGQQLAGIGKSRCGTPAVAAGCPA